MASAREALAKGCYLLRCKERSFYAAAANGHSAIWPEAEARSDGNEVRFVRDGKQIYLCNAVYAAFNFDVVTVLKD